MNRATFTNMGTLEIVGGDEPGWKIRLHAKTWVGQMRAPDPQEDAGMEIPPPRSFSEACSEASPRAVVMNYGAHVTAGCCYH